MNTNVQSVVLNGHPNVISLFAGCGGSSLGYKMAGFNELLAIDWDDNAIETFKLNFLEVPIWKEDINKLTGEKILSFLHIQKGDLDVLDGSPPCQGFSTAGKRNLSDVRNDLILHFIRLIDELQPKVFIMENVSGMIKGKYKWLFVQYMNKMKELNYNVKCKLMNAMFYNVPQSRERLIWIGIRKDLKKEPEFNIPSMKIIPFRDICWDLRGNRKDDRLLSPLLLKIAKKQPKRWSTDSQVFKKIKGNMAGSNNLKWLLWNRVCGTLTKSEISITGLVHPDRERYISLSEAKRISSFPDDFKFVSRKDGLERIGNSVPPLFMKAIAEKVKQIMEW